MVPAVLAGVALAAWLWLTLCRGLFWRTDQRLPSGGEPDRWPSLTVVVPARDEAAVLPASLPSLLTQRYPGPARVVLVDDNSTDGTGPLARELADRAETVLPLTVVEPGEPPPGWTGKLWALRRGIVEAGDTRFLLFTDADIAHRPGSLAALVAAATAHRLDLVSQMARLRAESVWERLIVPAFVYFFALLYPFRWCNRPDARTAAAAGGCTLVRRTALERAGGVAAVRGAVIDDVALARAVKLSVPRTARTRADGRPAVPSDGGIFLGLAGTVDSVRPYPSLGSLWRMVSRSAFAQLRHSVPLLAGTVLGLAVLFAVPVLGTVLGAVSGRWVTCGLAAAAWLLMAGTFVPMVRYYRQPAPVALLLPFTALLYLAMTVDSALRYARGRGAAWKGRTYSAG